MTEILVFIVVLVIAMSVLTVVATLPDPRRARLFGAAEALVRYSAVASVSTVATLLLYFAQYRSGSTLALAIGDGAMVLAPWALWTALAAVNGRTRVAPVTALAVASASTVVSLLIPEATSTTVKLVLVALGCLAMGVESLIGRVRRSGVQGLFTGVGLGFGGYMLARVVVIETLGTDSFLYERAFETLTVTVIGAGAVVATLAGVVLLFRRLTPRPTQNSEPTMVLSVALQVLTHGRPLTAYCMSVAHVGLIRRTHGTGAAQVFRDALVHAASTCFPSGMFAVAPEGDHLVVVEAEHKGAPSRSNDLAEAFDAFLDRADLVDLTTVEVVREAVTTPDELRTVLAPLGVAHRRGVLV